MTISTSGNTHLEVIQGDTLTRTIVVDEEELVKRVTFVSKDLGIQKELSYLTDGRYCLLIPSDETEKLEPRTSTYDLTFHFVSEKTATVVYNGKITVHKKYNKESG